MNDEFTWAHRKPVHTSPNIAWSRCDGCDDLYVDERRYSSPDANRPGADGINYTPYFCHLKSRHLTRREIYEMQVDDCPKRRELKRGKR